MTTAVDSSVLLDVLGADPRFGTASRQALESAYNAGALLACEVVWAEVAANFQDSQSFRERMQLLGLRFDPISAAAAELAGQNWSAYRSKNPASRERVVADFLVGAHALLQAGVLLTRDRGFYRAYFSGLHIMDPSRKNHR